MKMPTSTPLGKNAISKISSSVFLPAIDSKTRSGEKDETKRAVVDGEQRLRQAALHGDMSLVNEALSDGVAVDAADKFGNTPLMLAATRGRLPVLRELLRVGADMDLVAPDGGTCLHVAARWGHVRAVEELLRRGADATFQDKNGRTAADVCRTLVQADPQRNLKGVHPEVGPLLMDLTASEERDGANGLDSFQSSPGGSPTPLGAQLRHGVSWSSEDTDELTPNGTRAIGGALFVDEAAEAEEAGAKRRAKQDAFALANARHQLDLSGHEQALQVLEDWERTASQAMAAQEALDSAEDMASTVMDSTLDELLARVRELCFTVEAKQLEIETLDAREREVMALVGLESAEIRRSEASLTGLSEDMAKSEGLVLSVQNRRKLTTYELSKLALSSQEMQVEVARYEGRIEVKAQLEAELPVLKKAKKKAQSACRHLLRNMKHRRQSFSLRSGTGGPPTHRGTSLESSGSSTARGATAAGGGGAGGGGGGGSLEGSSNGSSSTNLLNESSLAEHEARLTMGSGGAPLSQRRSSGTGGGGGGGGGGMPLGACRRSSGGGGAGGMPSLLNESSPSKRGSVTGSCGGGRRDSLSMEESASMATENDHRRLSSNGSRRPSTQQQMLQQQRQSLLTSSRRGSPADTFADDEGNMGPAPMLGCRGGGSVGGMSYESGSMGPGPMLGSHAGMSYESMQEVGDHFNVDDGHTSGGAHLKGMVPRLGLGTLGRTGRRHSGSCGSVGSCRRMSGSSMNSARSLPGIDDNTNGENGNGGGGGGGDDEPPAPMLTARSSNSVANSQLDETPRSSRSQSFKSEGGGDDDPDAEREVFVYEPPDRYGGLVPARLVLKDDGWKVLDELRKEIFGLRQQVRSLGETPHC